MEQIYRAEDIYSISSDELRKRQGNLMKASFKHHYDNCEDYRKYCDAKQVNPDMINSIEDAPRIPLLDSWKTLRDRQFLSVPEDQIIAKYSSTGTTGRPVLWVPRDKRSFDWQVMTTSRIAKEVSDLKAGDSLVMVPDMPNLPFSQILKEFLPKDGHNVTIGLTFEMKDGRPDIKPDVEAITKFFNSPSENKNVFGYPFTIAQLKEFIDKAGINPKLGDDGIIMTAGGWKAKAPTMAYASYTRPEMEQLLSDTFGVPKTNIRDVYGATELVSSCWECKFEKDGEIVKHKHVPPWMYLLVLDQDTLEPVEAGQPGRAAFLDFAVYSHPGFILTDDMLKIVSNDGCECGKPGQIFEFVDRVKEIGERGCAFVVQNKLFSEEYVKEPETTTAVAGAQTSTTGEVPKEKETGVVGFVKKQVPGTGEDEVQASVQDVVKAMESILGILKLIKVDESVEESLAIVDLAKHLCYKKGMPTVLDQEHLIESTPGVSREKVLEMLENLERAEIVIKQEEEGKIKYQITKKADELGEAMFPVFIWALKWSQGNQEA
jgi:long-chain-fatty-acid---luciferin-component ligase